MFSPLVQSRGVHIAGPSGLAYPAAAPPVSVATASSSAAVRRTPSATAVPPPSSGGWPAAHPSSPRMLGAAWHPSFSGPGVGVATSVQLAPGGQYHVPDTPVKEHRLTKARRSAPPTTPQVTTPVVERRSVYVAEQQPAVYTSPRLERREVPQACWVPGTPHLEHRASPVLQYRAVAAPAKPTPMHHATPQVHVATTGGHGTIPTSMPMLSSPTSPPRAVYSGVPRLAAGLPPRRLVGPAWQVGNFRPVPPRAAAAAGKGGAPLGAMAAQVHVAMSSRTNGVHMAAKLAAGPAQSAPAVLLDDAAIQNTVAMLPPSPVNSLLDFLAGVVLGDIEPAMCHPEVRIDAQRYWEMRRVQNSVRRLLESLQEILGVEPEIPTSDFGAVTWDALFAATVGRTGVIGEAAFTSSLEGLGAWPPEMSPADRTEVFAALRAPCAATVRALNAGQPLAKELSRRMLCEGFSRVPFNVPDFPVPSHLLQTPSAALTVTQVSEAVAATFSMEQAGMDRVKDFFLCGLLSLEEIQAGLPFLVADSVVEQAVIRIIRAGTEYFTPREWQSLVVSARLAPLVQVPVPREDSCHEAPQEHGHGGLGHAELPGMPPAQPREANNSSLHVDEHEPGRPAPRPSTAGAAATPPPLPMTEPLPSRAVRPSEEPMKFHDHLWNGGPIQRVINWTTTRFQADGGQAEGVPDDADADPAAAQNGADPHQADEGAGTHVGGHGHEQGIPGLLGRELPRADDPVHLISLDMHNECLGPFLARAFVRCCQLYEARVADYRDA